MKKMGTSISGVSTDSIKLNELIEESKKAKKTSLIALTIGIISLILGIASLIMIFYY